MLDWKDSDVNKWIDGDILHLKLNFKNGLTQMENILFGVLFCGKEIRIHIGCAFNLNSNSFPISIFNFEFLKVLFIFPACSESLHAKKIFRQIKKNGGNFWDLPIIEMKQQQEYSFALHVGCQGMKMKLIECKKMVC